MKRFGLLLATRRYWPLPGGWETVWAQLLDELVRRGHSATVVTPAWHDDWPRETLQTGVRIVRLQAPVGGGYEAYRYLKRLTQEVRRLRGSFDAALVAGMRGDAYAMVGEGRRTGFPTLLVPERPGLRGDCHWQIESRCGPRVKRRCYQAQAYLAATPLVERELIAAGFARSRIHRATFGLKLPTPTTRVARLDARRNLAQADPSLHLGDEQPLVVYVGRLRMGKGLDLLLGAWRDVAARHPTACLWLVGEGPDAAALRERTFELGIVSTVRICGAFDDADDVYRAADVAVCPALEDGPAVGLLEAAAYGLPVVASDVATHGDLLAAGREAMLYPRHDVSALGEVLSQTLAELIGKSPSLIAQTGAARTRVEQDYSITRMADDFERRIADCLTPHDAGGRA